MIDLIKEIIKKERNRELKVHRTREFLQILILKIMWEKDYFKNIAFLGGTALRLFYGLNRFSEDLDFSLLKKENFEFDEFITLITKELNLLGFDVEKKSKKEKAVKTCMIKFPFLLYRLNLSPLKEQKLSIRIEIDTTPPSGWNTEIYVITKEFVFTATGFDLPSMFSTKLHACFFRKYTKGRDFYDLLWYLGKKVMPNFTLLNNAIYQTEKTKMGINKNNFKEFLKKHIQRINFKEVKKDVEIFLTDKKEAELLEKEFFFQIIETNY